MIEREQIRQIVSSVQNEERALRDVSLDAMCFGKLTINYDLAEVDEGIQAEDGIDRLMLTIENRLVR